MRKLLIPVVLVAACAAAPAAAAETAAPQATTVTVRYGPYTIPASVGHEHGHLHNQIAQNVPVPCRGCYLTAVRPDLVYADGSRANVDTGPMLHHTVLYNKSRTDPVCGRSSSSAAGFLGERFAASGNERTEFRLPAGYGYLNSATAQWNMVTELMNHAYEPKTVYVTMTFTYVPQSTALRPVQPVWLSVAGCATFDEYTVPAGYSATTWEWRAAFSGRVVGIGGHIHNDGVNIRATDASTGATICNSVARYGETPDYVNLHGTAELSSMSVCAGDPVATLTQGRTVRVQSVYDAKRQYTDAMGIMIAYIARS